MQYTGPHHKHSKILQRLLWIGLTAKPQWLWSDRSRLYRWSNTGHLQRTHPPPSVQLHRYRTKPGKATLQRKSLRVYKWNESLKEVNVSLKHTKHFMVYLVRLPKYSFWNCWNSSSVNRDSGFLAFLTGRFAVFLDCLPVLWLMIWGGNDAARWKNWNHKVDIS